MQLALEKAGIDEGTFRNESNSINTLTPEEKAAMREAEREAKRKANALERSKSVKRLREQNEYLKRELAKTEAGKLERKAIRQAAKDFAEETYTFFIGQGQS